MDQYFEYLEDLRQSGEINMYGAVPCLYREFPELSLDQAKKILTEWMASYGQSNG